MNQHEKLIEKFYTSFQKLDAAGMNSCYHNDILFFDPVFQDLHGDKAKAMWQMLCSSAIQFSLTFSKIIADDEYGSCTWQASYIFSATGRKVVNYVNAKFRFRDGLIVEHMDDFDVWKWSRQALGLSGILLGWSPLIKNKISATAAKNLDTFIHKMNHQ
ncbi:MAG: nuclear transport factor 2 family protein [Flavitalea sp.]